MSAQCQSPLIVALDMQSIDAVDQLAAQLDPQLCRLKVGKELFTACGMPVVERLQQRGFDIFLDLKFHDIPNTVARAVEVAARAGIWMVNVHASGGERMLAAAREAVDNSNSSTLLIAVTVLTSMQQSDLTAVGITRELDEQVLALASIAQQQGLDGVVCSARETARLRQQLGDEFLLVTPGIRPEGSAQDDQQRICTPVEAIGNGSNYLVIGRPVTRADEPASAVEKIYRSLEPSTTA